MNLKSWTLCLSEYTKSLKQKTKIPSKIIERENNFFITIISFEAIIEKMSVDNRLCGEIEASKLELETTIENKIDQIKSDHMKNINSLDIKI